MRPPPTPTPLPRLMATLAADPGRPRLTWYGPAGERIELSGHVLDNWVTKTANLLVEEFRVEPETRVLVDLPVHWRAVVWSLAVWRVGACVVLPGDDHPARDADPAHASGRPREEVVVTDRPEHFTDAADLVAVALPALARQFEGSLPPGAIDAASAVMTYGDLLTWMPESDLSAPALRTDSGTTAHIDLIDWAMAERPATGGDDRTGTGRPVTERVLLEPSPSDLQQVLAATLATYARDGSVILCAPEVAEELAADPARRAHLVDSERATA